LLFDPTKHVGILVFGVLMGLRLEFDSAAARVMVFDWPKCDGQAS